MATNYTIKSGEYITLELTPTDQDGSAVDLSSGYTLTATVKSSLDVTDAAADVHVNSTDDSSRFTLTSTTATVQLLLSTESETLLPTTYYFDIWASEDSTGQHTPLVSGTITVSDSVTDEK
jgi:hypothetical protein